MLGPQTYHRLPEMVARAARAGGAVIETDFATVEKFDALPEQAASQGLTAFLTVQEGCDKFCSFCVVPYTRGAEMSRPAMAVLAEARRMVAGGTREITLLGPERECLVRSRHGRHALGAGRAGAGAGGDSGAAAHPLHHQPPARHDDALIAAHRDVPALMPFLHLPVQSGSDRMLAAMNRRHTADDYRRLVDRLRAARPDLALSSDFIVGHPGETDADHAATMALVREVGFAQAFSFKYSPRPGTPAAGAPGQVPEAGEGCPAAGVAGRPARQPGRVQRRQRRPDVPVLVTGPGRRPGQLGGRTPALQPVHFPGPATLIGTEVPVRIVATTPTSLTGLLGRGARPRLTQPAPALAVTIPPGLPVRAVTMQFDDNALLPLLLGDHDRHLARLEQGLGVRLACRGNRVSISGDPQRVEAAQAALGGLWQRLQAGRGWPAPTWTPPSA